MKNLVSRGGKIALAMAAMTVASTAAFGVTKTYIGTTTGHFNVSSNWMPSGAPANGDDVTLGTTTYTATDDLDVTLDTTEPTGTNATYNSLTLDSAGLLGFMILNQTAGTLTATTETIGKTTAENTFNQDEGTTNTVVGTLNIGVAGSQDTYNLSGTGNFSDTKLNVAQMNIGVSGAGTFTETGGDLGGFIFPNVTLGVNFGGSGTVNLSGSQSEFGVSILNVGGAGSGIFNQSSGSDVNAGEIIISSTSGTATYNYSGGTIETQTGSIQVGANGTFNVETGAVLATPVTVNSGGVFKMAGGSFDPTTGILYMNGGSFEIQGHNTSLANLSGNTINTSGTVLGTGNIFNGAATSAILTLDVPYTVVSQIDPGQIVQFGGNIFDGAAGSFGLAVIGGAKFGIGLGGSNSYSGPTTVAATLQAFANGAFSPNSDVAMLAGGVLDASTFAVSIGSLAGTTGTVNVTTGGTLTIGDNTSTSYSGVLTGGGTLIKTGGDTLTLNVTGTFTGAINIAGGTLAVGGVNGIPTNVPINFTGITGTLSVNANQTLAFYSAGDLDVTNFSNNATLTVGTNNVSSTIGGNFTGTGTLAIAGTGTYFLGSGASDTVPNQNANVTIAVNSGATLDLNKNAGTIAAAGPLAINGGTVILSASNQIASTSIVTFAGGTLNLNGFNATVGGLAGSVGDVALNGGTLTLASAANTTYAASLTGPGSFIKTLAGNFTLTGASTYTGSFTVNGGQLTLQNAVSASAVTANTGATVEFNAATFNGFGAEILSNSGATIEYLGSTISNAFLRGTGTHTILAGATSTFNGITTFNSTIITQNGPAVFNNFSNGGTLNNNAALTFNGATNAGTGIINVNNAFSTQDFGNEGVMNIASSATLTNSVSNLFLEGGSRTYIGTTASHGGTVTLQIGTTIEVNGALLVNDGTINGTTDVNYGGTAEGVGTYGPVNVTFGGVFQPGISSTVVLANNNTSVSALSGDGTIDNLAADGNITLNVNTNIANSFTGTIQNSNALLGLNLTGGGSLTLLAHPVAGGNSINTYTGGTTITSGSLIIGAIGAFPAGTPVVNNGSFFIYANSTTGQITGSGQLTIGSVATGNAIATIAPKSGLSTLASLFIIPGSKLDLTNNDLIIHTGNFGQIVSLLAQGYSHGTWTGSTGIASSVASLIADHDTTIGVGTGLTTFDGQSVLPSDILIKYTWLGDTNLDGVVNSADLSAISASGTTWQTGDFNYDAVVNADDYSLFMLGVSESRGTNISTTLPEPTFALLLIFAALPPCRRRKTVI